MSQAPFIKVEATKYTEVGFHGKDVDTIIKDLLEVSITMTRKRMREEVRASIASKVEDKLLDLLVGQHASEEDRERQRSMLREGMLEDRTTEVEVPAKAPPSFEMPSMAGAPADMSGILKVISFATRGEGRGSSEKRRMKVSEARPLLEDSEVDGALDMKEVTKQAIAAVEQSGIVFIDEIDKLCHSKDQRGGPDASAEGVQRDLLPLIEGCAISTKHGDVNTDFILFIASGAFHSAKPSDLVSELQGRLPVRVALKGLGEEELYRILTIPRTGMIAQQVDLLRTEQLALSFTDEAVREIARIAAHTNKSVENIGARRLHTVLEHVMEEVSFSAAGRAGEAVVITGEYVKNRVKGLTGNVDLRKYIL